MNRSRPTRLRDIALAEKLTPGRRRRSARFFYMAIGGIALAVVGVLGYGLVEHTIFHHHVDATIDRTDMFVKAGEHIQVNVVNACGSDGMAMKFTEFLRARKFDVPEFSTEKRRESHSRVLDRVGDPLSAQKVAYALGISPKNIETAIDSSLFIRATVVIGEDYQQLRPMK
ncbi:MAG: LytR C-terminal domain-containing protein [Bacteroidota bacterium]